MTAAVGRVSTIVTTKWLSERILKSVASSNIRVLDTSWHMPDTKRIGRLEYPSKHIAGAQFFDIDDCCDKTVDIDHMLPPPNQFAEYVGNLGISNKTHVVLYDNNDKNGLFSAPRVWWTFRVFGHNAVSILDGGLPKWIKDGYETTDVIDSVKAEKYSVDFDFDLYTSFDQMKSIVKSNSKQMADGRGNPRFSGNAPEPREGIKPGHIKGAVNIPYTTLTEEGKNVLKSKEGLLKVFQEAGVDLNKPLIASCGSGVTACHIALAAFLCGKEDVSVYDGSWTEWYLKAGPEEKECVPTD